MTLTTGEREWLRRIERKLDNALEATARQDERIKSLERAAKWIAGLLASATATVLGWIGIHSVWSAKP